MKILNCAEAKVNLLGRAMTRNKFISVFSFFLLAILCSCGSSGGNQSLIPRKVLFGNPERKAPRISPDGLKIAYLAPDQKGVLNVWLNEGGKESVLTTDQKRGVRERREIFRHARV